MNSISFDGDGNPVVSLRNTSAVYEIDRDTGQSCGRSAGSTRASRWARARAPRSSTRRCSSRDGTMTIFDDGAGPPTVHKYVARDPSVARHQGHDRDARDASTTTRRRSRPTSRARPAALGRGRVHGLGPAALLLRGQLVGTADLRRPLHRPDVELPRVPLSVERAAADASRRSPSRRARTVRRRCTRAGTAPPTYRRGGCSAVPAPAALSDLGDIARTRIRDPDRGAQRVAVLGRPGARPGGRVLSTSADPVDSGAPRDLRPVAVRLDSGDRRPARRAASPTIRAASPPRSRPGQRRSPGPEGARSPPATGTLLYFGLTSTGRSLLAHASGHRLAVSVTVRDASGATATANMTLVAVRHLGPRPEPDRVQRAPLKFVGLTDFVSSSSGVGGILARLLRDDPLPREDHHHLREHGDRDHGGRNSSARASSAT